ncbi:transcriptional regulator, AraC family [Bernardetia litoralis DSM 6794]|uniref:Transcriptional regulator, AraC family n=1 Tax=Bernardetia litoralis (strain ATCC 23117 / DSM 6794 / NBRC 15988 / NCIMB 1366 / Fx l1 / Sio-4) TaxID=880071 RepID=I4ANC0_BERLS|nr:AraC family transcriptional regulator [Bernardetia litoralis]AFM05455.1 transcriptional regulator, AraC family [Bernardetia litoralis DSM 6794]
MKIAAPHIANLFEYGSYQGINENILRTNLRENELDVCNPKKSVSKVEFLAIYEILANKTKSPNFGLHYGCYLNIKALGFISELSLNASSIEQAVIFLDEYLKSTFPLVTLSVGQNNNVYALELDCSIEDITLKNHILDTVFCFIYRELKLMLNDDFLLKLELPYIEINEYITLLSSEIFRGKKHLIELDSQVLSSEINRKRIKEIELLLPQFIKMLDNKNYKEFSLQIRNMILNMCCPEIPTFGQVSKQFALSDRTIQRKLTEEGQSFRKISDNIKKELSYYLAKGKQIKTQDIAYILGYSEPSAYLHAVKRWEADIEF